MSYLLEHLLAEGLIDTVVLAGRINTPPFFSYQLCHSADDVYRYSRSVYSVININQAINTILKDDSIQKVAVVALPCTSKALRNAVQYSPVLKGKLKYIIGITCGQQKSNNFIDYLASKIMCTNYLAQFFGPRKKIVRTGTMVCSYLEQMVWKRDNIFLLCEGMVL